MELSLSGCRWQVKGFWPYVPLLGRSMELGNELMGVTDWIDASVPGSVHADLLKAGIIEDPYVEMDSLKCEWVENRWWMYRTTFYVEESLKGKKVSLIFKGVDYKGHFYLNHKRLGEHEGMYEAAEFNVADNINYGGENELLVLLENAPEEMAQIGHTSMTRTQKSRFNYKWDFSTRLVNIGLWDDVVLKVYESFNIDDIHVSTDTADNKGIIDIAFKVNGFAGGNCNIKVFLELEGQSIYTMEKIARFTDTVYEFKSAIAIDGPELWYPNGYGKQPLYRTRIEVYDEDRLSDEAELYTGIRKLEYRKNEESLEDSLPYTFVVNGTPIYIKGVNLTPLDHMYGTVSKEKYEKYFFYLKHANINMVRVWGGGIIEKEYFYHLCDVNGIMVWQEFIQSSSGVDNIPSEIPSFLKLLEKSAVFAVKHRRSHVSHTLWSGGNELMDKDKVPVTYDNNNIKLLKSIVEKYDPKKLFLPTSASGPNEYLDPKDKGRNHDVHGNWKYEGTREHYELYNESDSLFHSEFGTDGLSHMKSLKKFLKPENLVAANMKDNLVWRHHGEWWDTYSRDVEVFGELKSLDDFVKASQFMQSESLRYALESNRRRKFNNSGSIIWQFNEPWPNVSCTNLVDYYLMPKMAYYWVREAYSPIHVSMSYDKLYYKPYEELKGSVYINNSLGEDKFKTVLEVIDVEGKMLHREEYDTLVNADTSVKVKDVSISVHPVKMDVFFVRLTLVNSNGDECSKNLYLFSQKEVYIFSELFELERSKLQIQKVEDGFSIKNTGDTVSLFVHGVSENDDNCLFIDGNYSSLFPGEERLFKMDSFEVSHSLNITWESFN